MGNRKQSYISLQRITKKFGDQTIIDDVSLDIEQSEFFCLLGGSGAGKTTLLRLLAGFETADKGKIIIDGQDMTLIPPYQRPINMMFQSYALFPHMTVHANIAYGLRQMEMPIQKIAERVDEMLKLVQMSGFKNRKPNQLSGGQAQRIALARALARKPKVLLLDEPLAALDKKLRQSTEYELTLIQESLGTTFIVVTHDQEEAMNMATKIGIMDNGKIVQVGPPREIYEAPCNRFVANFVGSLNLFDATIESRTKNNTIFDCPELGNALHAAHNAIGKKGQKIWFAIRPEKITIEKKTPQQKENFAKGIIDDIGYVGNLSYYFIRLDTGKIIRVSQTNHTKKHEETFDYDDAVYISWTNESGIILDK